MQRNIGIYPCVQLNGQSEKRGRVFGRMPLTSSKKESKLSNIEIGKGREGGSVVREGISLEYWYISLDGTYMRHRRISPFELDESRVWRNKQQVGS